ncbi:MAG: hypothetical protein M3076_18500 [Actinomycetota bacterium]|nr:hypothetical protein [Actinomycetota bacterium]
MQHRDAGGLGPRSDEEIGVADGTVVNPASPSELLVDARRASAQAILIAISP